MSDIVRLRSFPQTEVLAWLQALQSPDSYEDPTPEDDSDCKSLIISAAQSLTRSAARPASLRMIKPAIAPAGMPRVTRVAIRDDLSAAAERRCDRLVEAAAPPVRRSAGRILLAGVLLIAAVGLAVVGLTVNTRFAASFGQTAEAALLLAALGLTIDLLAIVLPSAAAQLWRDCHRTTGLAAWGIWLIALGMTLLAAIGFAATNIGDGVAGRSKVAAEASALSADVARLRAERAGITETRAVATIEAELQRAQPAAASAWRQTAGCNDVTLAASGAACAEVLRLRQALGAAQRRDALDAELRAAEARLAPLPAITAGDPQAMMAADILAWASGGHISLTPHDIHRLRVSGLTIIPALSGIIVMFATTLLRAGRRRRSARELSSNT